MSAPALSWDEKLYMTKADIELFPDADMYLFFEKAMTGRVSYILKRYSKANSKYYLYLSILLITS